MFSHKYKFLFIALLAIYSFVNIIVLEGDRLFQAELPKDYLFYTILFLCLAVWIANFGIERYILPRFNKPHPLIVQFFFSTIAVLIISLFSVALTGTFLGHPFDLTNQNFLLTTGFSFRINLFLNSINAIYFFSQRYKEKAVETEKLKTLTSEARYEMLNQQINPHFFFNNLNALSTLIHQDTRLADQYLQKLSEIYRYILKNKDNELVMLEEEMAFLDNYIDLLVIRFQNSLVFNMDVNEKSKVKYVPPAVLQLLVENVVKHNYFTKKEPLTVNIKSDQEYIIISNKVQKKQNMEDSNGIGLKNITERYAYLDKSVIITEEPESFSVQLPLINIK